MVAKSLKFLAYIVTRILVDRMHFMTLRILTHLQAAIYNFFSLICIFSKIKGMLSYVYDKMVNGVEKVCFAHC